jgi:hypothetical protein
VLERIIERVNVAVIESIEASLSIKLSQSRGSREGDKIDCSQDS